MVKFYDLFVIHQLSQEVKLNKLQKEFVSITWSTTSIYCLYVVNKFKITFIERKFQKNSISKNDDLKCQQREA